MPSGVAVVHRPAPMRMSTAPATLGGLGLGLGSGLGSGLGLESGSGLGLEVGAGDLGWSDALVEEFVSDDQVEDEQRREDLGRVRVGAGVRVEVGARARAGVWAGVGVGAGAGVGVRGRGRDGVRVGAAS